MTIRDDSDSEETVEVYLPKESRYDELRHYIKQTKQYPLLSREEELEIATQYIKTRNSTFGDRLVTANLRLVVKIASEYTRYPSITSDLVQEGNLGLLRALEKYDPSKGFRFPTYAAGWIRAFILRFIVRNARIVRVGTTENQRKIFFNLSKALISLAHTGVEVTPEAIAEHLSVPVRVVREMLVRLDGQSEMSLDTQISATIDESRSSLHEVVTDTSDEDSPSALLERRQSQKWLEDCIQLFQTTLKSRERSVFAERWLTEQPLTKKDLSVQFGVCEERIRQIEVLVRKKFKNFLEGVGHDLANYGVSSSVSRGRKTARCQTRI